MSRGTAIPWVIVIGCAVAWSMACKPERPTGASMAPVAAERKDDTADIPVARIGERLVRFGEIESRLEMMPVFVRVRHQTVERKLEFLEAYLEYTALALAAEARGLGRDGRVIDALKDDLAERWLRRDVDLTVKTSDIPEVDVVAAYEARWFEFNRPEQVRIRHLRVQDRALADKLAFRIRKTMETTDDDLARVFEGFVAQWSQDAASRGQGGAIGRFPRVGNEGPDMPQAVVEAAVALTEPFQLSGVVEAPDGFHILFLESIEPAVARTLDQARPGIVSDLMGRERTRLRRERLDALRTEAGVRVDEDALRRVLQERAVEGAVDG